MADTAGFFVCSWGNAMDEIRHGRCLCGNVQFKITGDAGGVTFCHCSMCRRQTGHHYATINVKREQIEIEGEDSVNWYQSSESSYRGFCGRCGSALFWKSDRWPGIAVQAGSLDAPTGLKGKFHIFVADKGDYYEIDDDLPQFAQSS